MHHLARLLTRTARGCPERISLSCGGITHTYAELDRSVDQLTHEFIDRGALS
ncbi:hypothetical protein GCM10027597_27230 [Saccharopolyspora tripterygii]